MVLQSLTLLLHFPEKEEGCTGGKNKALLQWQGCFFLPLCSKPPFPSRTATTGWERQLGRSEHSFLQNRVWLLRLKWTFRNFICYYWEGVSGVCQSVKGAQRATWEWVISFRPSLLGFQRSTQLARRAGKAFLSSSPIPPLSYVKLEVATDLLMRRTTFPLLHAQSFK